MRCVAELVSADTDSERAIRWLIALLVYAATRLPSHCRRPPVARSTLYCCRADAIGRHSALGAKETLPPLRMLRKRCNVQPTGAPFQNQGRTIDAATGIYWCGGAQRCLFNPIRSTRNYRCRCTSHRPRKWDSSPFAARRDGPRIRFGLERVIRYAAFCSSTPPAKLVAARRWSRCPPLFDERRH